MKDVKEISPLRGLVSDGVNPFLQRLGRDAAGMHIAGMFLLQKLLPADLLKIGGQPDLLRHELLFD